MRLNNTIKLKIYFITTIFGLFLTASCSKDDSPTAPTVSDQEMAEQFAWAVKSSVTFIAPSSETQIWSNATVSGNESGIAVVNGSFTYDYHAYSGRKNQTYNNVIIEFDKYCDDSYYPHLTGTVIIDGTCTTQYGLSTKYWGHWQLLGENIKLSGSMSGTASIAVMIKRDEYGGLHWLVIVETADGQWNFAY